MEYTKWEVKGLGVFKAQPKETELGLICLCQIDESEKEAVANAQHIVDMHNKWDAFNAMYEALKELMFQFAVAVEHPYSKDTEVYERAENAINLAEGKEI